MSSGYQVFARKYRPRTFEDVLGQEHVVQTLRNAIEKQRLAHAYLFVGPRGTGKTSTARIFAKALNCPGGPSVKFDPDDPICREIAEGNSLDVLEIDGASNNGVEQVRALRDGVGFAPSSGQFRIYYIDEVHMLSAAAFNALLKTLEEPPAHVKFIFATTDPQKILPTIISRCQRFDLRRIPTDVIAKHLRFIATEEGIELSESAAFMIARGAEGGMRDAQSMLDQLVAFCGTKIEEGNVLEIFGFNSAESVCDLAGQILRRENSAALESVHRHSESGKDLSRLLGDLIGHLRNVLVIKVDPAGNTGELPSELLETVREQAAGIETPRLLGLIDLLAETDGRMKWASNKKLHFEIAVIKAIQVLGETSLDDVIALISAAAKSAEHLPPPPGGGEAASAVATAALSDPGLAPAVAAPASLGSAASAVNSPEDSRSPEPEISKRAAPVGGVEGEALWEVARDSLIEQRPLFDTWLKAACFVAEEEGEFVIGFSTDQRLFRDSITRYEKDIADEVSRLAGRPLKLRIEVRDDIEPTVLELEDDEPTEEALSEVSGSTPDGGAAQAEAPASNGGGASAAPWEEAEAPVQDALADKDPLIEEALAVFDAKKISNQP